jgi:hypothetical protein
MCGAAFGLLVSQVWCLATDPGARAVDNPPREPVARPDHRPAPPDSQSPHSSGTFPDEPRSVPKESAPTPDGNGAKQDRHHGEATASVAASEAWRPRADGAAIRTGEAGNAILPFLPWSVVQTTRPATLAMTARSAETQLALIEAALIRRANLGPPPWDDATFTIAAIYDPALCIVGRDIALAASPEASARWFLRNVTDKARFADLLDAVTSELADYQHRKRQIEIALHQRILELDASQWLSFDALAYYAADGRVCALRAGDIEFDELLQIARRVDDKCIQEAREIIR